MQPASWLTSRELAEAAGPWDTRLHLDQDGEYFCRVLLASEGTRFVPGTGIYYRATPQGRRYEITYLDSDGPFGGFRVLVWPASILTIGLQNSYFTLTFLYSVLLNISIYLVIGCLVWLGLQRPRSIVYLTIVGTIYLTVVGVAGFCELLLA